MADLRERGERLADAIERAGKTPRNVADAIEAEARGLGLSGYSFASLYRFQRGEQWPSRPVLELIARELGVLPAWLETGKGPRTIAEARITGYPPEVIIRPVDPRDAAWSLTDWLLDGAAAIPRMDDAATLNALSQVVARLIEARGLELEGRVVKQVAAEVEAAVVAALEPSGLPLSRPAVLAVLAAIEARVDAG